MTMLLVDEDPRAHSSTLTEQKIEIFYGIPAISSPSALLGDIRSSIARFPSRQIKTI